MPDAHNDPDRHIPKPYTANSIDMLVAVHRAHVTLSQMADQKASILMGATFVIFTITIGQARGGTGAPLPLLILGGFAFFSAVLAVLAILPHVHTIRSPRPNLLFFGSFTQLGEEEYIDRLCEQMQSDDTIFATMARDIYQNGQVLEHKKYRLLGYAYRVFLVGLTASFLAFVGQYLLHRDMPGAPGATGRAAVHADHRSL
ncbi:Pycsar system effector family protein [Sphingomonas solaris]|uniref:Pycsar system effector family protein n=1 Tax=Alterirhizorhabdus solaris TaxID=2529389 RepID=UPI001EF13A45|nr:Pycsar system effector family protein [Sphingomonas solaris]